MNYNTYIISINKMQKFKDMGVRGKELEIALSGIKLNDFIKIFVTHLKEEHKLDSEQVAGLFSKSIPKKDIIPISIFNNSELSCLEAIVKYLKEEFGLRFSRIAVLLNRDDRTIWSTYNAACKKRKKKLHAKESKFFVPALIFEDRKLGVLESIVCYLKDNFNLRYSEISILLNRDERNIWTAYNRAKKKKK